MTWTNNLSAAQLRQYDRDGIAYPIEVMSAEAARRFRTAFEELALYLNRKLEYVPLTHLYFRWAFELATWPSILDAVEQLLGPDVLIEGTLILCKHGHDPALVTWHQDLRYAPGNSSPTVSAWVALSNSTRLSGCMQVIPGSHKEGMLTHSEAVVDNNMVTVSVKVDGSHGIDVELKAGQMSLHQADIVHGSLPNQSDDKRIGFIIRFVTPQFKNQLNPIVRARGSDPCHNLTFWPAPLPGKFEHNVGDWLKFVRKRNLLK